MRIREEFERSWHRFRRKTKRFFRVLFVHRPYRLIALIGVCVVAILGVSLFFFIHVGTAQRSTSSASQTTSLTTTSRSTTSVSLSSTTSTLSSRPLQATYVTSSPVNTSQWLIVKSLFDPVSIVANNTGQVAEFQSLQALNSTRIGVFCVSVNQTNDSCDTFKMYDQTGWFWDSVNDVLYVHYVGGPAVEISIVEASKTSA